MSEPDAMVAVMIQSSDGMSQRHWIISAANATALADTLGVPVYELFVTGDEALRIAAYLEANTAMPALYNAQPQDSP